MINFGLIPVALTSSLGPKPIKGVQINFKRVFGISRIGFIACGLVGVANTSFFGLGPQFALAKDFSTPSIGIFMASAVFAGASIQVVVGWLADRMNRELLLNLTALLAGLIGACLYVIGNRNDLPNLLIALSFLWGAFAMPLYSLAIAIANDRAKPTEFLELSGGLLIAYSCGAVLGPFFAPFFIKLMGSAGLFFFTAFIHFGMAGYVFYRRRFVLDPIPDSEREEFKSPPRTTPVIFELDPRGPVTVQPEEK